MLPRRPLTAVSSTDEYSASSVPSPGFGQDVDFAGISWDPRREDGVTGMKHVSGPFLPLLGRHMGCDRHMAGKTGGQERLSMIMTAGLPTGSKRPVNCRPPDAALMRKDVIESPF
jgi:hypothetical protein